MENKELYKQNKKPSTGKNPEGGIPAGVGPLKDDKDDLVVRPVTGGTLEVEKPTADRTPSAKPDAKKQKADY